MSHYYKELKSEWEKRAPNLARCGQLLDVLKLELVRVGFASPQEALQPKSQQQMVMSRDMLEIAVEHSITVKDYAAFERYMAQLNMYYYDYDKYLQASSQMYKFLGLNLLYMLAHNRIADFHIELERLPSALLLENPFIQPVLALENYYMEGRYNKILQAKRSMPSAIYASFMDMLVNTARDEIASCMEKSYDKMSPKQAALRLGLKPGGADVAAIANKRSWPLDDQGNYNFIGLHTKPKEMVSAKEIAGNTLTYAHELEKIV
ncbi:26S proteasome non-ATPase regulatory subunit 8 [Scaptodrosophila lebanonensis]|uniref:26S proteasome non-ATPase regulatory subunit 8 n=1 Tax=Drosophila lebanonensis TaxID=7225 RepID=A0A6J2UAI1_DROLE|nr:26S proteasome non-ATPase regulatory subunit 8 [Scaptodrosophila lebanonensis]